MRTFREFLVRRSLELEVEVSRKKLEERRLTVVPRELLRVYLELCYKLLNLKMMRMGVTT